MINNWIHILKCPITGKPLRLLHLEEITDLNHKAARLQLWHANGTTFNTAVVDALISEDNQYVYPVIDGIVLLLKDLAVVDAPHKLLQEDLNSDKQLVRNFYDQQGWVSNAEGDYTDAVIYEDLRPVSAEYIQRCHERVKTNLLPSGEFLLDAASGAIQFDIYHSYAEQYTYRVCVDFSFRALKEAKQKIGRKGIFLLCDIANLPLRDNTMDGFISLNTIYHIPADEQIHAVHELYRSLKPGGKGVLVYEWFKYSSWMNLSLLPFRGINWLKNRFVDGLSNMFFHHKAPRQLYYFIHPPASFLAALPKHELKVWRSLSVPFMRYYIHDWLGGKTILNWIYQKEEHSPAECGRKGEYPMMVFTKQ
ncbi:MAG: class I SAM-dependent methyltransferase [Chitinophagaceae bacterium]